MDGMSDIRIITGKHIVPDVETAMKLAGCGDEESRSRGLALFAALERSVRQCIRPKGAAVFKADKDNVKKLYVVLTLGTAVSRQIEMFTLRHEYAEALMFNAMADSCLFSFEMQFGEFVKALCREQHAGIRCRHEAGIDSGFSLQQEAVQAVEAERTLGVSVNDEMILQPEKSMAMVYDVVNDESVFRWEHDCRRCGRKECALRKTAGKRVKCPAGKKIGDFLRQQGLMEEFPCGGSGQCGKCRVCIEGGFAEAAPEDRMFFGKQQLKEGWRLACKAVPNEDVWVYIPKEGDGDIQAVGSSEHSPLVQASPDHTYGAAIDIGTTTIAAALVDLTDGTIIHSVTAANSQRALGADVISRIAAACTGSGDVLRRYVIRDIEKMLTQLQDAYPLTKGRLCRIAIAGNTTMLHLLMGWDCSGLGTWPFHPVSLGGDAYSWSHIFGRKKEFDGCEVLLLPGISTYVGADSTAGIWKCGVTGQEDMTLFLDLGTNGELALGNKRFLCVAAAAAGPALEGSSLTWGMASVPGAICGVDFESGNPNIRTIAEAAPAGICGTGVVELTAGLLEQGIINKRGTLSEAYFERGFPVAVTADHEPIVLTQKDIRKIQLAKSAVRSGIETLLHEKNAAYDDIGRVYLAGGFGYFLNPVKAAAIGLLPKPLVKKTTAAGNTSLYGAAAALMNPGSLAEMMRICCQAEEITLADHSFFHEMYVQHMDFHDKGL